MKKIFLSFSLLALLLSACTSASTDIEEKDSIIVSFYVLEDLTSQIVGDNFEVVNLLPAGTEPHGYELSTQDMVTLQSIPNLIVLGNGFESWLEEAYTTVQPEDAQILNLSSNFEPLINELGLVDPHTWTSPRMMKQMIQDIQVYVSGLDPDHASVYADNAAKMITRIEVFEANTLEAFKSRLRDVFVVQHPAFAYLALDYALNMVSIQAPGHEGEADAARVQTVIELIKAQSIPVVFYSDPLESDLANTVALDAQCDTAQLYTMEFLTSEQAAQNLDVIDLMGANLETLSQALQ